MALSVLGFGALIPQVMRAGAVYHFAGVGTSGAYFDPTIAPQDTNAFSRTYYTIRGWYPRDFIVTGIERINGGMYSGSSTVSHEFAHLIHGTFARANAVPEGERSPARSVRTRRSSHVFKRCTLRRSAVNRASTTLIEQHGVRVLCAGDASVDEPQWRQCAQVVLGGSRVVSLGRFCDG